MTRLLADRADVIVPDLRGFGESDKHKGSIIRKGYWLRYQTTRCSRSPETIAIGLANVAHAGRLPSCLQASRADQDRYSPRSLLARSGWESTSVLSANWSTDPTGGSTRRRSSPIAFRQASTKRPAISTVKGRPW